MKGFWPWGLCAILVPALSSAQSFYDSFDEPKSSIFADESEAWDAVWDGDPWTSFRNPSGVCPVTDESSPGSLGEPVDAFENIIVAGQSTWRDYAVEASFYALDNDAVGIVVRYASPSNFYLVVSSRNEMPSPMGSENLPSGETRLYRISQGVAQLMGEPAPTAYTGQTSQLQRLRVEVFGKTLRVLLGTGASPIAGDAACVLELEDDDPSAPISGRAGLYAFAQGAGQPGSYFDTFRVSALDSDGDGKVNDDELDAVTNPYDGDSDDDGVSDGNEFRWTEDADSDGLINALDPDADGDGLPDGLEQGLTTPHPDTDLLAGFFIPDADPSTVTNHLWADTDRGGAKDGEEDANHNGRVDKGERDPRVSNDDNEINTGVDTGSEIETSSDTQEPTSGTIAPTASNEPQTDTSETTESESTEEPSQDRGQVGFYGGPACDCTAVASAAWRPGKSPILFLVGLF
ncbi:MAG: hypothetical protein MUC50_17960 [Myxococcota bacterium]|jgi:hypothetical protein|nr:hypothetical protein [Myxococcota bacterium]